MSDVTYIVRNADTQFVIQPYFAAPGEAFMMADKLAKRHPGSEYTVTKKELTIVHRAHVKPAPPQPPERAWVNNVPPACGVNNWRAWDGSTFGPLGGQMVDVILRSGAQFDRVHSQMVRWTRTDTPGDVRFWRPSA